MRRISIQGHVPAILRPRQQPNTAARPPSATSAGQAADPTSASSEGQGREIHLGFLKIKVNPRESGTSAGPGAGSGVPQNVAKLRGQVTPRDTSTGAGALSLEERLPAPMPPPTGEPVFPAEEACRAQLPKGALKLYDDVGLRVTPDTLPKSQEFGHQAKLQMMGSGSVSSVYLATGTLGGSEVEYAFKPLTKNMDKDLLAKLKLTQETGIPIDNRQVGMRNMATQAYAKLLDFDVIVDTSIQVCKVPVGHSGKTRPQVGLLMAKVEGMDPGYLEFSSLQKRAEVTCEITKLQLLDHLTGEVDRHSANFKVQIPDNARARVIGFDNDLSFGKKLVHPEGFTESQCKHFNGSLLPPVVDREMFDAINNVTPDQVKSILENKLDSDEVSAALQRLEVVKQHVLKLEDAGCVIDNMEDWAKPQVLNELNEKNSYVGRLEFDGPDG